MKLQSISTAATLAKALTYWRKDIKAMLTAICLWVNLDEPFTLRI